VSHVASKELIWFTDPKAPKGFSGFPMDISELQELIEGARTDVARKNLCRLTNVILNGALTADSNKRPNQIWSDEDSALLNRMATVTYSNEPPERKSSYKNHDPQKNPILRDEMGALLCLMIRCYQDLLIHAGDSTFVDWKIPLFEEARDAAARQNDPLFRYLTLPKGEVMTKDTVLWCEYDAQAHTPVRELKKRFLAWMEFDQKKTVNWDDIDLEHALKKASQEHDGVMRLQEPAHWYKCNKCGRDVDCNRNKAQALNDCCEWYRDTKRAKAFKSKRTKCNKVKKKEIATIKGLKLCEEPRCMDGIDRSNWKWNGKCGCGKPAATIHPRDGGTIYHCFFGASRDAKCSMKWVNSEQLDDVFDSARGTNWPN
jgi:hypothetical protein